MEILYENFHANVRICWSDRRIFQLILIFITSQSLKLSGLKHTDIISQHGKTAETVKQCVCACVCVCMCACEPTVRLRPAAERGNANIQTLQCSTAAAAGLLYYMRDGANTDTHKHWLTLYCTLLTHTHTRAHTAKSSQLWVSCISNKKSLSLADFPLSLSLSLSVFPFLSH